MMNHHYCCVLLEKQQKPTVLVNASVSGSLIFQYASKNRLLRASVLVFLSDSSRYFLYDKLEVIFNEF